MKNSFYLLATFFLIACSGVDAPPKSTWSEEQISEKKQLVNDLMAVHDSTMEYMDEIHLSIEELNSFKLRSNADSSILDSAIGLLEVADESMMQWMRTYREPKDTVDFAEARKYLLGQKMAIEQVEKQTDEAISFSSKIVEYVTDSIH